MFLNADNCSRYNELLNCFENNIEEFKQVYDKLLLGKIRISILVVDGKKEQTDFTFQMMDAAQKELMKFSGKYKQDHYIRYQNCCPSTTQSSKIL
jgi:hypothetical protein